MTNSINIPQNLSPDNENSNDLVLEIREDAQKEENKNNKFEFNQKTFWEYYNTINEWLIEHSPVRLEEKLHFFQLMGSMHNAGISINESLQTLEKQVENLKLKRVIKDMNELIESGENLANAMRQNDDIFDESTCSVIEAGEKSGKLNEVVKELTNQYTLMDNVNKKIKSVMLYPLMVILVMILASFVVLKWVIPKLVTIFAGQANLPLPTRILMYMSDIVINRIHVLILGFAVFVLLTIYIKKNKTAHKIWQNLVLVIPIIGNIVKLSILARVTRIFGFLISAGVPIVKSLRISADVAKNAVYRDKLLLASDDLTKGIPIAENLSDNEKLFPLMLVNMISIGEKTASLEKIMQKVANFYNEEFSRKIKNLSTIMEPIILIVIAAGALFIILAIFIPIINMNDAIMGNF